MEFAQTEKIEQMAQQIIERAQLLQQQKMQQQTQDRPVIVAIDGQGVPRAKRPSAPLSSKRRDIRCCISTTFSFSRTSAHRSGWHSRAAMSITSASGSR